MATLTIDDATARKIFPTAAPELKAILSGSYPKDFFSGKITDRIKTFEDACDEIGLESFSSVFSEGTPDEIAFKKIKVIAQALNEGWIPDWNNGSQYKWYPWFYMDSPGFRFFGSSFSGTSSYAAGGARLCFKSEELSNYAAKQFFDLYKAFIA